MSEQTRLPLVADDTLPDAPQTAMAVVEPARESKALVDLRQAAFSMPVPLLKQALAEYDEQRQTVRDFLLSKMVEGVHYAYPPKLEPKYDDQGNMKVWNKQSNSYDLVNPKNWRPKQSLYKAGGEMVCDLMGVRCEFSADTDAWQQLGSPKETFVMTCRLHSRATGELLGEGRGVRRVGQKGGDANNAIKMAQKCAMVDAVLTTYGLSDLFTQDIEDEPQPPHDNPTPREDAPKVKPRSERSAASAVTKQVKELSDTWKSRRSLAELTPENWSAWVHEATGDTFNVRDEKQWTADALMKVRRKLDEEDGYVG